MGDIDQPPHSAASERGADAFTLRLVPSIADVQPAAWDACAGPNPFTSHAFLHALETSDSATAETGWLPQHLLLQAASGELIGCMPCYLKSHSRGEYVFDQGWADAYLDVGGRYYPKLQASVPFTPVTGRRLLVRPGAQAGERGAILLQAARQAADKLGVSSLHVTFLTREEWQIAGALGLLQRTGQQFHWLNENYASFDDFLGRLASRKRKTIRRERRDALSEGIEIEWVTGNDLTEAHLDTFFAFYIDTGSRKWGSPYLTRACFSLLRQSMADRLLLVLAKRDGRYVAGALNVIGGDTLYGRYWGGIEHHPFLHFEVCYYQAIDFAIQHRLARVEAGAQGAHKLARGYLPSETYSAHYIAHPGLRRAVADFLKRERRLVARDIAFLNEESPYRRD